MNEFLERITDQLNLSWAWEKVRRASTPGDTWIDEIDLASFELELERNLLNIAKEMKRGRYRLSPLRPLPFPKHPDPKTGEERVRQSFNVSIKDQVAWTAVVNVVGPYIDSKMPTWSYGNRLYRSIWVETDEKGIKQRRIGNYRHASGQIYLPFNQSWPVFRRHVYLATRKMTGSGSLPNSDEWVDGEDQLQAGLKVEYQCPFVIADYWKGRRSNDKVEALYWCSIDLEKFYPSIKLNVIRDNIIEFLPPKWKGPANELLKSMLHFRLNLDEWPPDGQDLKRIGIRAGAKRFMHIPTGLYVSGFLANAGLIRLDQEVDKCLSLPDSRIAHFRFVDDHIILAYSFDELKDWVFKYQELVADSDTGVKFNLDKIEPKGLAPYLEATRKGLSDSKIKQRKEIAESDCKLDPKFPSPLMTKTLALVSAIARADFNLLESSELASLTDQLEHLLLVDLPEEEMPAKTRVSFAAGRLTKAAECRLANPADITALRVELEYIEYELNINTDDESKKLILDRKRCILESLETETADLCKESKRTFQLLQKVLRERPDRTRLWTRAILMCRITGVQELSGIREEIESVSKKNRLAGYYLHANFVSVLAGQVIVAARTLSNESSARWQKDAAKSFIQDLIHNACVLGKEINQSLWYHRTSWLQLCMGLHTARILLESRTDYSNLFGGTECLREITKIAKECIASGFGYDPAGWAWWSARFTLNDLDIVADRYVVELGKELIYSSGAAAYWRFYPKDVPDNYLDYISSSRGKAAGDTYGGWWYDALRSRREFIAVKGVPVKVVRILGEERKTTVTLYQWIDYLKKLQVRGEIDPRMGEWTALEIIRQVCKLLDSEPTLNAAYFKQKHTPPRELPWIHPANFLIPKSWMNDECHWTWSRWRDHMDKEGIVFRREKDRIVDLRYTPLRKNSGLFQEINTVRGIGLLLFGLLTKRFDLPTLWNGPGHADVLGMLPKLLLGELACSSWTLGILQGCLSPRVNETSYMKFTESQFELHDDTVKDPLEFRDHQSVNEAVQICQCVLTKYQLSTLNHNARQLVPISIQQLTGPDWKTDLTRQEG